MRPTLPIRFPIRLGLWTCSSPLVARALIAFLVVILAGGATALQAPTNARLATAVGSPVNAAFISFAVGTAVWIADEEQVYKRATVVEIVGGVVANGNKFQAYFSKPGELVEAAEPTEVGADLMAGSLIKNLGGTIAPTGGYVAGRADLVEQACCRLTAPGIGAEGGTGFDLNRLLFQGLFLAPQMVAEAVISADRVAQVFANRGLPVQPLPGGERSDVIQAVKFGAPQPLQEVCRAVPACSPIGGYVDPVPAPMPGYASELVMAGGTFIDGSTSEFSADGPLREPYVLYSQGGTHRTHAALALAAALTRLEGCPTD